MTIKEKIIQYLEYKLVSKSNFYKKIGVSNSFLASGKTIGSDKLILIRDNYPDLNMNWLIFDDGEMLITKENNHLNKNEKLALEERVTRIENFLRVDKKFDDYIKEVNKTN